MNLMVVEDEAKLRENIVSGIPWERHGIEVVGAAASGREALKLFDETKPDIVLLDIRIPEPDGLVVAATVSERNPRVKIVLLSGHDNFRYAQKAIDVNVVKYLLKPARDTEILSAVLEARKRIEEARESTHTLEELRRKWNEHAPRLQELLYQNWVAGTYSGWEVDKQSADLTIDLSGVTRYAAAVVEPDPLREGDTRYGERDGSLLQYSVTVIAKDYFAEKPGQLDCKVFPDYRGSTVLLFLNRGKRTEEQFVAEIQLLTSRLLTMIKEYIKTTASAGIGLVTADPEGVSKSYQQANKALQERIVYGDDLVVPYREGQQSHLCIPAAPPLEKQLENALETGNREKALETVDRLIEEGIGQAATVEEVHENVLYFSSLLIRTVHAQGWPMKEVVGDTYDTFQDLRSLHTKEQIRQWLHGTIRAITDYASTRNSVKLHDIVRLMLEAVENDIHRDLTLHVLARKLFLTPSYLSRLFKQHTGQAFSDYVLERKMKRAMELLESGAKVLETSAAIGYRDVSYFTKVFRKHWGMTPGEIKKTNG
ncbi:response regulator [Paenibacillus oceani]|uniref:Response regulator n=1 Tax=Paenibacillus oceani TaxID=2772510 RepID=A0A927H3J9_9BACL|nr:response regulator [Paenibacillus oceani]MBD2866493.1 response regulator [Paenibacillus oceani]